MTIEKLEEFASNGDKHLTGLDVATGFPRADKPERPWFNKLFGDITGKINEVVDNIDGLPPFEGGVLADTFVTATANGLGGVARTQRDKNSDILTPMDFGAKGNGVADDSANIQAAIYYSILNKNVLDGLNKTYKCSNVIFDSNLHFINAKLINNGNADLISVLTTVISRDWLENVTLDNIHIDGNRINQTAIKSTTTSEDGGRHGIRIRRPARHIRIKNSSANYCAGDGICIYPDVYSGGDVLTSVIDFVIEDSVFDWNRRHGGSSDRTDGMTWRNVKCRNNGLTLLGSEGAAIDSGAHGDTFNGNLYANGWDVEEYDDATHSKNLLFENCEMTGNAKGGLIILPTANCITPTSPTNIKVIGGRYDRGIHATAGAWGVSITPNGLSNPNDVFENTIIDGVVTDDTVILRNNKYYVVINSNVTLNAVEKSSGYFDTNIKVLNQASSSENNTQLVLPVGKMTYNKTFNLMQISELPDYEINVNSYGTVEQKTYTHQGASKGKSVISVSDIDTTYRWQTSTAPVDTLRVNDSGVSMRLTGASKPANTLEMTFEAVTNTEIKVYMKGTDGITRSGVIALT